MEDSPYNAKPSSIPKPERTCGTLDQVALLRKVLGWAWAHYGIPRHLVLLRGDVESSLPASVLRNHAGNYEIRVES